MRLAVNGKPDVDLGSPKVMGVLNLTPDSFSDGGRHEGAEAAEHVFRMIDEGAAIIDIGGESTRPGSSPVSAEEEIRRIIPFLREHAGSITAPISVDTMKAEVAEAALDAGADIINDVSGLRGEGMAELIASADVPVVIMHMHGTPSDMRENPIDDITAVIDFLRRRKEFAEDNGIRKIIMDPGVGFGKTAALDEKMIDNAGEFSFGCPVLIGASRKSFLKKIYPDLNPDEATALASERAMRSGANILRVHDVKGILKIIS